MYTRFIIISGLMFLLCACTSKKPDTGVVPEVESDALYYVATDTVLSAEADSIPEIIVDEPPFPSSRAEVFDDFISLFASDKRFQLQRVMFPLPYYEHTRAQKIEKAQWAHDSLFLAYNYYTLLLDHEDELESEYPDTLTSAQIEWISLNDNNHVKRYYFERLEGKWKLEAVDLHKETNTRRSDFIDFFVKFTTDSVFQMAHVRKPLLFITADPDDDFNVIKTTLDEEQWLAFKPTLPTEKLFNIVYGNSVNLESRHKILQLKGVGNGFANTLFFRYKQEVGDWELYKFEDTSN